MAWMACRVLAEHGPWWLARTGEYLYGTGYFASALAVFRRNRDTGKLVFLEAKRDGVGGMRGLRGPAGLTVRPDGRHIYVAANGDQGIGVFRTN